VHVDDREEDVTMADLLVSAAPAVGMSDLSTQTLVLTAVPASLT
jgi:hypothetical protein